MEKLINYFFIKINVMYKTRLNFADFAFRLQSGKLWGNWNGPCARVISRI